MLGYFNIADSVILGGLENKLDFWRSSYYVVGNGLDYVPLEPPNDDVRQKRQQEGKDLSQITRPILPREQLKQILSQPQVHDLTGPYLCPSAAYSSYPWFPNLNWSVNLLVLGSSLDNLTTGSLTMPTKSNFPCTLVQPQSAFLHLVMQNDHT